MRVTTRRNRIESTTLPNTTDALRPVFNTRAGGGGETVRCVFVKRRVFSARRKSLSQYVFSPPAQKRGVQEKNYQKNEFAVYKHAKKFSLRENKALLRYTGSRLRLQNSEGSQPIVDDKLKTNKIVSIAVLNHVKKPTLKVRLNNNNDFDRSGCALSYGWPSTYV